ncbi:MAG: dTMP kinase, partial [Spirochaetota bacterium]
SSRAYRGVEADPRLVHELNARFPEPAVVFFLDLPVSEVDARLAGRELREIYERTEFQARVRERYVEVLSAVPDTTRVVTLDATAPEDEIAEKIWETLEKASIL